MANYLVVKNGNQNKSYELKSSHSSTPYLKVNSSYLDLTTETTVGIKLKIKNDSNIYRPKETVNSTRSSEYTETTGYSCYKIVTNYIYVSVRTSSRTQYTGSGETSFYSTRVDTSLSTNMWFISSTTSAGIKYSGYTGYYMSSTSWKNATEGAKSIKYNSGNITYSYSYPDQTGVLNSMSTITYYQYYGTGKFLSTNNVNWYGTLRAQNTSDNVLVFTCGGVTGWMDTVNKTYSAKYVTDSSYKYSRALTPYPLAFVNHIIDTASIYGYVMKYYNGTSYTLTSTEQTTYEKYHYSNYYLAGSYYTSSDTEGASNVTALTVTNSRESSYITEV